MSRTQYNAKISNLHQIINEDSNRSKKLRKVFGYKSNRKVGKKQLIKKYAKFRKAHDRKLRKRFNNLKQKGRLKKTTWNKFRKANSFDQLIVKGALEEWDIIFDS